MVTLTDGVRVTLRAPGVLRATFSQPTDRHVVAPVRGPAGVGESYVQEQVSAHALDPTPHPAYDDMQDLATLVRNRLV